MESIMRLSYHTSIIFKKAPATMDLNARIVRTCMLASTGSREYCKR